MHVIKPFSGLLDGKFNAERKTKNKTVKRLSWQEHGRGYKLYVPEFKRGSIPSPGVRLE